MKEKTIVYDPEPKPGDIMLDGPGWDQPYKIDKEEDKEDKSSK